MLFSAILTRVDTSGDSYLMKQYLGYLLILFVVPGYINMVWQCVKAYLALFHDDSNKSKPLAKIKFNTKHN